ETHLNFEIRTREIQWTHNFYIILLRFRNLNHLISIMGATLSSRAQWTSASEGAVGKLEINPQNEQLLTEIAEFTEVFPSKYPAEAEKIFNKPFTWNSSLDPISFTSLDEIEASDMEAKSKACNAADEPLLTVIKDNDKCLITAATFEQLSNVLKCAGNRKLSEVQACLEANRDPISNMMGPAFARIGIDDTSLVKAHQLLVRAQKEGNENVEEINTAFNLLLVVNSFDMKLMQLSFDIVAKEIRLSPEAVERDVNLLRSFSGADKSCLLRSIEFMSDYVFANGCRAPPWRQVHGDIAYIIIKPFDIDEQLVLTANTSGYYRNKGVSNEGEIDYTRIGEVFPTLVMFMKEQSAHFVSTMGRQEFAFFNKTGKDEDKNISKNINFDEDEGESTPAAMTRDDTGHLSGHTSPSKSVSVMDRRKPTNTKKKPRQSPHLQPSQKWRNLGFGEDKIDIHGLKDNKNQGGRSKKSGKSTIASSNIKKTLSILKPDEDFSESSSESEEEEDNADRRQETNADLPSEYWQIQKLVKYLKVGNSTATVLALCCIRDFNLAQEACQLAIRKVGGLEVLINLLDTDEIKCKIGSLKILKDISRNTQLRRAIVDLGGLQTLVKILDDDNKDLKCLAAETIANVAKFRRARRTVRLYGGIIKLGYLLDYCLPSKNFNNNLQADSEKDVNVARCGALALWSCSKSTKNKQAIRKAGGIPYLAKLLKSKNEEILIPVVGTLQECASERSYRLAIRTEGMIEDLVNNLNSENQELQMHCASAIFKCAEEEETRNLVRQYGGLDPLVRLLQHRDNKELLAAATGAIWKCSKSPENVLRFQELEAIEKLVGLLTDQPEEVLINVVGALGECAAEHSNQVAIRKAGGIPLLVNLLTGTNQALLVNVTKAVGACAIDPECMYIIDRLDGVRLLWSLLKSSNPNVQASSAWAICPCIENAKDAGEMVRSFVGGLELIVSLLKSEDKEVLASVCAAIANIAKDEENLAVITDHGVVPMLAKLATTTDDHLRRHLAEAIARCCMWGNNRVAFGAAGAVAPLVHYLKSPSASVHRSTAKALFQLSKDPNNCITMHENGVVKLLIDLVGSTDSTLQEASAGCISNIRRLALANEKARNR
ncbi:Armadillo repeat-containing protein 4, partial [Trichoplax sp. H2]